MSVRSPKDRPMGVWRKKDTRIPPTAGLNAKNLALSPVWPSPVWHWVRVHIRVIYLPTDWPHKIHRREDNRRISISMFIVASNQYTAPLPTPLGLKEGHFISTTVTSGPVEITNICNLDELIPLQRRLLINQPTHHNITAITFWRCINQPSSIILSSSRLDSHLYILMMNLSTNSSSRLDSHLYILMMNLSTNHHRRRVSNLHNRSYKYL